MSEDQAPETATEAVAPAENPAEAAGSANSQLNGPEEPSGEFDELADLDDIDFDLDEVESKIAPLALALVERRSW